MNLFILKIFILKKKQFSIQSITVRNILNIRKHDDSVFNRLLDDYNTIYIISKI